MAALAALAVLVAAAEEEVAVAPEAVLPEAVLELEVAPDAFAQLAHTNEVGPISCVAAYSSYRSCRGQI